MVGLVLTPEQVRAAPPEVREWLKNLMEAEFAGELGTAAPRPHAIALAACSREEAASMLERIQSDHLLSQVFFELGRDSPPGAPELPQVHRTAIADIMRHTRLSNLNQLGACLNALQDVLRALRNDPTVVLFALDQRGAIYVDGTTHQSIKRLWLDLINAQMAERAAAAPLSRPGFATPDAAMAAEPRIG